MSNELKKKNKIIYYKFYLKLNNNNNIYKNT